MVVQNVFAFRLIRSRTGYRSTVAAGRRQSKGLTCCNDHHGQKKKDDAHQPIAIGQAAEQRRAHAADADGQTQGHSRGHADSARQVLLPQNDQNRRWHEQKNRKWNEQERVRTGG